ncbi:glycosyltransferase [Lentzea guizhouensis]|uniref:glycosyltransferase n=1 Tax=Lentzea guizhouensis TaxID=1586287 RepID=UPI001472DFB7|nr:nucleotide disphospho-sugar-binding domain-containing protein [Lentzea guizhouensis]
MLAARCASAQLADDLAESLPDLVVADVMTPWAVRVARRRSVRVVSFSTTFTRGRQRDRPVLVHALPELQPMVSGRVHVLGPLVRRADTVEEASLGRGRVEGKVLLVSPGTVFEREPEFFRTAVEAFGDTDWTVVLSTGALDPGVLGTLPANVTAYRSVPQLALLRSSTVFLTHAGMNSTVEALSAGVPMVLAPRCREQRATARRLVRMGVGVSLPRWCHPVALHDLVERVAADPQMRTALRDLRESLPGNGAEVAAAVLRAHAGVSGSPRNTEVMSTSIRAAAMNSSSAADNASALPR